MDLSKPINVDDLSFDRVVMQSAMPVVVEFWSPSCMYCLKMAKVLDDLAKEYYGRAVVAKVSVQDSPRLAARFGVTGVPVFILFKYGLILGQTTGAISKGRLKTALGMDIYV
jgi:thioredoxin 1